LIDGPLLTVYGTGEGEEVIRFVMRGQEDVGSRRWRLLLMKS